jgi:hypothetical protein
MQDSIPKIGLGEDSGGSRVTSNDEVLIPQIVPSGRDTNHDGGGGKKSASKKWRMRRLLFISSLITLLSIIFVVAFLSFGVYKKALFVKSSVDLLVSIAKEQDLEKIKTQLGKTREEVIGLKKSYSYISFLRFVPLIGRYIDDGRHAIEASLYGIDAAEVVIKAVEPYADIIGFSSLSSQAKSGEETTQDRIDFIVKTIPDLIPVSDQLIAKLDLIDRELSYIDPQIYPEKFQDIEVRNNLVKLFDMFQTASSFVKNGKPLLEIASYLIGIGEERTYLVLFQNDKELRPTGGFLTAYSIARVKDGKFDPVVSSDIYSLDKNYRPSIAAPRVFAELLKGIYIGNNKFRLRDMNWSPDFGISMKTFSSEVSKVGMDDIDGIIAVDTQLLVNILEVIGPIGVPGYGNFSTEIVPECKCPQVIYELESFADQEGAIVWSENEPGKIVYAPPNYDNRKKIIGPLMNSILSNTLGQPKDKLPRLFEAAIRSVAEKHVLVFILDDEMQKAVNGFGLGGDIKEYDGDYLHINDANLGGRKSNLYVVQDVVQDIKISKDGSVEKILEITYKNPEKQDGWLNSILPNHVRIYVPKGSELLSFDGAEKVESPYEELEKTVFAGSFHLRPQGVAKLTLRYKLPIKVTDYYRLLIQKQPGKDKPRYSLTVGKKSEEFYLSTDKEIKIKI